MRKQYINRIFEIFTDANADPKIELFFLNPYTLLVAVVLSAQATDKGVNKVTIHLFDVVTNPRSMLDFGYENLCEAIMSIGLWRNKAKNIIDLSEKLIEDFDGVVPNNLEDLMSLPGVGRKSANVILNCIFGQPTIAVDTHVFRVSNRIGLASANDVLKTEKQLLANIPKKWLNKAHYWLVLHGRYICIARKPKCKDCSISSFCDYYRQMLRQNVKK